MLTIDISQTSTQRMKAKRERDYQLLLDSVGSEQKLSDTVTRHTWTRSIWQRFKLNIHYLVSHHFIYKFKIIKKYIHRHTSGI
ncbi:hypothetical protein [Cysteiniphilum marinum]|uniref:hypothetical protein n=1 Tax=Cysteiniphilum marinum TaxID=2774191 RepID=UPI00193AFB35|nr:hypothetical protein [Cysteiniphilum marinum]